MEVTFYEAHILLLTVTMMVVVMAAVTAGQALAACESACNPPPPGLSNANAFAHANDQAQDALLNNALKRQGPK